RRCSIRGLSSRRGDGMRDHVTAPPSRAPKVGLCLRWLFAAIVTALSSSTARAQSTTFYLDRLEVGGAPDDGVSVWRPDMGEKTRFFGQLALGFGLNPFRLANDLELEHRQQAAGSLGAPVTSE